MEEFKDENSSELHFYYNKEQRLKTAPKIVQDFHNGTNEVPPKGIFRRLVYTRSSRLMLFTIVILCLGTYAVNFLTSRDNKDKLLSVPMSITAFPYEDSIYVSIKAGTQADAAFSFDVSITSYTSSHTQVSEYETSRIYDGKELVIGTIMPDYDILSVEAVLTAKSGETIRISTDVTR